MFVEEFDKKYGYKPEWGANNAYMQFAIWARMVSEAGTFYPPAVIKEYEKGEKFDSTVGEVYFRAADHQLVRPVVIVKGKAPKDMKNNEDYWSHGSRARRAADAEARRVRLQARRLHLTVRRLSASLRRDSPVLARARLAPVSGFRLMLHSRQNRGRTVVNWANFVSQCFNGLVLGALLALISSGLTIIYGTLGVLNLAHGAMFMLGGYAGWVAYTYTGSFIVAVIAGSLFVMLVGVVIERVIIRRFYSRPHEDQLLVTFGLGIVIVEAVRFFFGSLSKTVPPPPGLVGITPIGFMMYPTYRLALLGIVAVALIVLYIVLYRTRIGMIVRAGIEDSAMVDALGIDVYKVFMLVFGIGAMAAGFAGIVNAPVVSIAPDVGKSILVQTFVVVVIGGVGSFPGAVLGGLIAGEIISITSMFNPGYAYVMLFVAMTLVLVLRPYGLLGAAGRE